MRARCLLILACLSETKSANLSVSHLRVDEAIDLLSHEYVSTIHLFHYCICSLFKIHDRAGSRELRQAISQKDDRD